MEKDLDAILDWSSKWLLRLNPEKCTALPITNKRHPIIYTYQLNGHPIIWSSVIRYLGVYISSFHTLQSKLQIPLTYIQHVMFTYASRARSLAVKCLVRLQLQYACQVWNPHLFKDIQMLEGIHKCAAMWTASTR